jgi:uncharacterized SAM-binding protein YcdF (DUF218 family)
VSVFFLIKRLEFLLQPFTWALILLALAWYTANPYRRRRLIGAALGILLFFSNSFIVDECYRWWEVEMTQFHELDPSVRTAILLGGGLSYDKDVDRVNYGHSADRYVQVLEPYHRGLIDRIVVVGGAANFLEPETREGDMLRRFLLTAGVAEEDIIVERQSRNTHENALYCRPVLQQLNEDRFLLVTSSVHMRRSMACFEKQGVDVQPYAVQKRVGIRRWELDFVFVPKTENFGKWAGLLHEWVGFASYRIRGYC